MARLDTRVVPIDPAAPELAAIAEAAAVLQAGHLVAFPTETVYGLGSDGLNPTALARIYAVKGRPSDNPLILHLASRDQLSAVAAGVTEIADVLIDAFWPGPLTLVLPKHRRVPDLATGGLVSCRTYASSPCGAGISRCRRRSARGSQCEPVRSA